MGAMKRWMHDVYDDCLSMGVRNTAKKYDISADDVKTTTMNHAGWNRSWSEFVIENDIKQIMANANQAAKKRGL
tara:strand:+ start:5556 stop:5777 length:222 start_codon:yes stop_codon:yes gene_type:complete